MTRQLIHPVALSSGSTATAARSAAALRCTLPALLRATRRWRATPTRRSGISSPRSSPPLRRPARGYDVVRTVIYVTDIGDADLVGRAHSEVFGNVRPASTMVQVSALIRPEMRVEIEAYAVTDA